MIDGSKWVESERTRMKQRWGVFVFNCRAASEIFTGWIVGTVRGVSEPAVIQSINSDVASIDTQARETVVGAEQLSASSIQLSQIVHDMEKRIQTYKV